MRSMSPYRSISPFRECGLLLIDGLVACAYVHWIAGCKLYYCERFRRKHHGV